MNLGNTPTRLGKPSLSPMRSRRTESSAVNRSLLGRRRMNETYCINDPQKVAKYMTSSEDETLYYCEKCAILLASQGFAVQKLTVGESMIEVNPRK